jgi:hypothetical protein
VRCMAKILQTNQPGAECNPANRVEMSPGGFGLFLIRR